MAVRQYIGARYVPTYYQNSLDPTSSEWEANVNYDPLTIVSLPNMHSYQSKKFVPSTIGSPASNPEYWYDQGYASAYYQALQDQIDDMKDGTVPGSLQEQIDTNTSDITALTNNINAMKFFVTPEMFGAAGDGVTDDTDALQNAFIYARDNRVSLYGFGNYLISAPIELNGFNQYVDLSRSRIYYNGLDCAFAIHRCANSTFKFGDIDCSGGSGYCIKFYNAQTLTDDPQDFVQYVNIYAHTLTSNTRCISYERNSGYGWVNEIRIHNAYLSSHNQNNGVGVYIKGVNLNGWSIIDCGIEQINIGVYTDSDNDASNEGIGVALINCRSNEDFNTLLKTVGKANIYVESARKELIFSIFDFSNTTNGSMYGIFVRNDHVQCGSYALVRLGVINVNNMYLEFVPISDLTLTHCTVEGYVTRNGIYKSTGAGEMALKVAQMRVVVDAGQTDISIAGIPVSDHQSNRIILFAQSIYAPTEPIKVGWLNTNGTLTFNGLTAGGTYAISGSFV